MPTVLTSSSKSLGKVETPANFTGSLFVHIGPHKTGTTSIQSFLSSNYEKLAESGILYPKSGRWKDERLWPMHHPMALSILDGNNNEFIRHIRGMKEEIQESQAHTIVLSTEVLSRETAGQALYEKLMGVFPKAKRNWILYLRKQDELLMSIYSERVKIALLKWPDNIHSLNDEVFLNHERRIEKLRKFTDTDNIIVCSYDKNKRDVVAHFLNLIGICEIRGYEMPIRQNESLGWGLVEALRIVNALPGPARRLGRRVMFRINSEMKKRNLGFFELGTPLSDKQREEILLKYKEANDRVEAKFFTNEKYHKEVSGRQSVSKLLE